MHSYIKEEIQVKNLQVGDTIEFNASRTLNPSLKHQREQHLPMQGSIKAIETYPSGLTVIETYGSICIKYTAPTTWVHKLVEDPHQWVGYEAPMQINNQGATFEGISIE
ncbi:hypothetical protein [Sphaerothrix gracilis]|uniref:hypothetical protein n=1 Tax=Sphaerothrix gracilis TaxID=3151835 RepID=UPI0031FDBB39